MRLTRYTGKIVPGWLGGYNTPPDHPERFFYVEYEHGFMSLRVAIADVCLDKATREAVTKLIREWEAKQ